MAPRTFAVERLASVIGLPRHPAPRRCSIRPTGQRARTPPPRSTGRKVFAFDIPIDRATACIAVAGLREDGSPTVEVVQHEAGTAWVVDRLVELVDQHGGEVVVDDHGPAASPDPRTGAARGAAGRRRHERGGRRHRDSSSTR